MKKINEEKQTMVGARRVQMCLRHDTVTLKYFSAAGDTGPDLRPETNV